MGKSKVEVASDVWNRVERVFTNNFVAVSFLAYAVAGEGVTNAQVADMPEMMGSYVSIGSDRVLTNRVSHSPIEC